jgi:hypothetical protein
MVIKKFCNVCYREISRRNTSGHCASCAMKVFLKNPVNHPNYKDGRTLKTYTCKICNLKANKNRTYWTEFYTNKINVPIGA